MHCNLTQIPRVLQYCNIALRARVLVLEDAILPALPSVPMAKRDDDTNVNTTNSGLEVPDYPNAMLRKIPRLAGFISPALRTVLPVPGFPSGDFDASPRPPKPDYNDPRSWAARPAMYGGVAGRAPPGGDSASGNKRNTTIPTAEMVPPSLQGVRLLLLLLASSAPNAHRRVVRAFPQRYCFRALRRCTAGGGLNPVTCRQDGRERWPPASGVPHYLAALLLLSACWLSRMPMAMLFLNPAQVVPEAERYADCFFVHPTTYFGPNFNENVKSCTGHHGNWDEMAAELTDCWVIATQVSLLARSVCPCSPIAVAVCRAGGAGWLAAFSQTRVPRLAASQATVFNGSCRVWAPEYRQASITAIQSQGARDLA